MKLKKILYDDVEKHQLVKGYFFTEEELFEFTYDCMREKAKYDDVNFTPLYEVLEFLKMKKDEIEKN